jgi:hypothetical protein
MNKRLFETLAVLVPLLALACRFAIPQAPSESPAATAPTASTEVFVDIPLQSEISGVQPMTGLVYWSDSGRNATNAIQLEFAYVGYSSIVSARGLYNWSAVENILDAAESRHHQAILRFYYVYPGYATKVPDYIKQSAGYVETPGTSEGLATWFPDWSFAGLRDFTLEFYTMFAARYDADPRLAFLQTGFGLWAEYHIYDGPMVLGGTFPSKAFQTQFLQHLDDHFDQLPWSVSIDAANPDVSPLSASASLLALPFGLFDDSFLCEEHDTVNAVNYTTLQASARYAHSPIGGELSYYEFNGDELYDQRHALDLPSGPHGTSFENLAARFHVSYMIGNDQPDYQSETRIKQAGMASGYRFRIDSFSASASHSRVRITNTGIAPIYRDAYAAVNGVRSPISLKGLLPGASLDLEMASGGAAPVLSIECDHLVAGQKIEFAANL